MKYFTKSENTNLSSDGIRPQTVLSPFVCTYVLLLTKGEVFRTQVLWCELTAGALTYPSIACGFVIVRYTDILNIIGDLILLKKKYILE